MIVFRHADPRFPFLWESAAQPAARWHAAGDGPAQYFAETADGAWAEFLRHEQITDPADLAGVVRSVWAVDIGRPPRAAPILPAATLTGGLTTYADCQAEAARLRRRGASGLRARSAALDSTTGSGFRTDGGLIRAAIRDELAYVVFGPRPDLVGWAACSEGRPRPDLLARVRPLTP